MKKLLIVVTAVILVLMVGLSCAAGPQKVETVTSGSSGKVVPPAPPGAAPPPIIAIPAPTTRPVPTPTPAPTPYPAPQKGPDYGVVVDASSIDRMIVRTGQIAVLVDDLPGAITSITNLAQGHKGYVVSSNSWREGERLRGVISIRVPAADFDQVMKALNDLAVEVTSQTSSSQDVTQEYTDLGARLSNLQAAEQQLLRIMDKATKVEDILSIQRELTNTRGQIEQIKARMLYLERTSDTSLINVTLDQAKLDIKFTSDRVSLKAGESVRFNAQVSGGRSPYNYAWDFGDGGTSTIGAPSYAYKTPGTYSVTVKVTDDRGNTATQVRKDYIGVQPGWSAGTSFGSAWHGLGSFGRGLADVLIWLAVFSPLWIAAGGVVAYILWRRRSSRGKAA